LSDNENSFEAGSLEQQDARRIAAEIGGVDLGTDPFVAAVRATRMPMIISNPRLADNPVVFANDAFCRLSGYSREEILGRNCRFLQGPGTDRTSVRRIHDAVAAERSIEIDIRNYRKDGDPFWNRLLMAPVFDVGGKIAYFFASQVDVTIERDRLAGLESHNAALTAELAGRRHAQQESERELSLALDAARLGAWSLDLVTGEFTTSAQHRMIFEKPLETPVSYDEFFAAIHPEDQARVEAAIQNSLQTGADYDIEYRILASPEELKWVALRGQPTFNAAGTAVRLAGVSIDVTSRKRAETMRAALVELADILRDLDNPSDITFAAAELLGRTLGVSRAGYGQVNMQTETIEIDRDWNAPGITTIAGVLKFRDYGSYIDDLQQGRTAVVSDARLDPRTSATAGALEKISARAFVNMPLTEHGGLVALLYLNHKAPRVWCEDELAFVRDVAERTRAASERRRAEQKLADLAASLEQQVEDRTHALLKAEEALRQAQKMEAVGQLTGGLAHDFNNLLTGITGSLELLQARLAQGRVDAVDRYVAAAQGAARRAASLTQRLLAFSRRQTLEPKPTNVNGLVTGMEELIRRSVGPSIEIEVVGAGGLWTTLIDPGQLENALLNLCLNARDAMPQGGRLTIETANKWLDERGAAERDLEPGQFVSLCVSDTGTGMTPDVIARAFDPFFTTKPIGQGTGLGLSMIYGFVRQSGGQVRIYSEVGHGTTMCLYLPRHHGDAAETEEAVTYTAPGAPRSGETVLVVDDEPTVRMLVMEVLQDAGYVAIEASDGAKGLKILESKRPIHLLITDVGLPGGMNGRQLADAARVRRPDLKVLFITGYAENAAIGNGHLEQGMSILTKPFTIDSLTRRFQELIAQD
jgi:PAS domain S-box-containing protein